MLSHSLHHLGELRYPFFQAEAKFLKMRSAGVGPESLSDECRTFKLNLPGRTSITKEQAVDLFAPLATERFETVEISGHCVTPPAAQVAANALSTLASKKCLRSLIISDCIAGLQVPEALSVLTALCDAVGKNWNGLRVVDLSSNALGSRGVAACVTVIRDQPQLEELILTNNGLAKTSTKLLRMHLCTRSQTSLKVFHCTLNCIESEGLKDITEIVKKSPNLEHLRLSSLRAGSDATSELCKALSNCASLRVLDLSDNGFNETGVDALSETLKYQKHLEALLIRDLSIDDDSLEQLLDAVSESGAPLDTLDISGNDLTSESCPTICRLICASGSTLRCLYLSDNELLGKGIMGIARTIEEDSPSELRVLSISGNQVRDYECIKMATAALKLDQFLELDINENYASIETVNAIRRHLGEKLIANDEKMVEKDLQEEPEDDEELYSDDEIQNAIEVLATVAMERGPLLSTSNEEIGLEENIANNDSEASTQVELDPLTAHASEITSDTMSVPTQQSVEPAGGNDLSGTLSPAKENTSSARKLNSDLAEIRGVLTGFVQDLSEVQDVPPRRIPFMDSEDTENEEEELQDDEHDSRGKGGSDVVDVVGGLFVSIFVVILVLSIAKSNEENFSWRPV